MKEKQQVTLQFEEEVKTLDGKFSSLGSVMASLGDSEKLKHFEIDTLSTNVQQTLDSAKAKLKAAIASTAFLIYVFGSALPHLACESQPKPSRGPRIAERSCT